MKKFNVTFTETTKYNPATRTLLVEANDELHARYLITSQFDSFMLNKKINMVVPSGKKINITDVKEVKEKKKTKVWFESKINYQN